ncbi:MarR family winged helix-turn-helix transcriptional regulator [Nocardioides mangrovi]|uniref:MarR family transcriptional regulator n=1 Tax=Nocardioides mangrovi TaxID=2874580 RepID=A0ABS7UJ33_9ACTN|nr:MarR family transcriptional regulator [Nocardioides mangrovi]MBZ5740777.1 MarR family transcriptional regulator [Nocardioides mangrovi]
MERDQRRAADQELDGAADVLLRASKNLMAISVRSVLNASTEITVAQHRVLVILADHGVLTVNQIADHLGVDASNAGRHCQRLNGAGMVDRVRSESDRRSIEVVLTDAGRSLLHEVAATRRRDLRSAIEYLSQQELSAVLRGMTAFNRAVDSVERSAP